jgi:hypothetical protein
VPAAVIWDGAWHHVVGTYDGSRVRLSVDGAQVGDGTPATFSIAYGVGSKGVYLGTYRGSCELGFKGDIDDVRIWDDAPQPPDPTLPVIPPVPGTPTTMPVSGRRGVRRGRLLLATARLHAREPQPEHRPGGQAHARRGDGAPRQPRRRRPSASSSRAPA